MRRRAATGAALVLATVLGGACGGDGNVTLVEATPECEAGRRLAILAQAVPTASYIPCVADEDSPWRFRSLDVERGSADLSFVYIDPSGRSARVELTRSCDTAGATELAAEPGAPGVRRLRRSATLSPRLAGADYEVFEGGCVTTRFDLPRTSDASERLFDLESTVGLFPRDELREELEREFDLELDAAPAATTGT